MKYYPGMQYDEFKARLIVSKSDQPLVTFDMDNLYWSQDHIDGKVDTYKGLDTFTNKVDLNLLERICTVRLLTPSYGYFILNIWQKDIIDAMKKIGFSIEGADYYMIDRGSPVEIDKYDDTDIQFDADNDREEYVDSYLYSRSYKYGQELEVTFYKNA